MRLVLMSDTHEHNLRTKWTIPDGDILIHAGDLTARGSFESMLTMARQLGSFPHRWKFFVPGNHERFFQRRERDFVALLSQHGIVALIDEGIELPSGLYIYGTPWQQITPEADGWLEFKGYSKTDCRDEYSRIPRNVDILVTHQPQAGILSRSAIYDEDLGSTQLANQLAYRTAAKLHVFGHVHEQYGYTRHSEENSHLLSVNASMCSPDNKPAQPPWIVDYNNNWFEVVE